jgi:transcriptional regulator with XRE-family HTH domain
MNNYFASNLKFLRKSKGLTQGDFAPKISINRPKVGSYEEGRAEPNLVTLQNISHFFKVKLDDLIEKDLSQAKRLTKKDFEGNDLRILPIIVNENQTERISMVPVKAAAGYLNGYADPEFIEELPNFNLPINEFSQGTYRAFQIKGDSMLPIQPDSYVLAEYLENWKWIKDNQCYIVVSKEEGVVYKRVINQLNNTQSLELHSDNTVYEPYQIAGNDILEVWQAKAFLSFDIPEKTSEQISVDQLSSMMQQLKNEVDNLKKK